MIRSNPTRASLPAILLLAATASWAASKTDAPVGWASQNGGTTGGAGGTEVTVTTMADLQKYAKMSGKYIIWVSGTFGSYGTRGNGDADKVTLASDKSILGLPGAHIKCSMIINGVSNVIVRNLTVEGAGACDNKCGSAGEGRLDAITVLGATHVWLDHLDIFDGEDGNTDITKNADLVTVSSVKFHYTTKSYASGTTNYSHRYCNLIGSDDSYTSDDGKLNITFFKTWWGEGVAERMPRVRFGKVHVANCLFTSTDPGQMYCVRAGHKANLLVEGSVFNGQTLPIDLYNKDFTAVTVRDNLFTNCSGNTTGSGTAFNPPYTLALSPTAGLEAEISNSSTGAGPTLTWSATSIAPAVDHEASYSVQLTRQGELEMLTNPAEYSVALSIRNLLGQSLCADRTLAPGASTPLPRLTGSRVLRIETPYGQESRILSLR